MRILGLFLLMGLLVTGCATFNHSEYIDTDQLQGYAAGKYTLNSAGRTGSVLVAGTGAGWGGSPGVAGGLGGVAVGVETGPPKGNALNFAKSVAMINYSKKLKYIKYDVMGGVVEYQFDQQPLPQRTSYQSGGKQPNLPASFGYQPVE